VLRLRRLVVAEADRFPDIALTWFEGGFDRTLVLVGEAMTRLADHGLLRELPDPTLAAYQFAGTGAAPGADELERIADRAAEVFRAAYGPG
jgi:TetR/AcrR family transcriptional repressor of mexJK operon